ncbi:hypothetical protein ASG38_15250 [Flavobacterium sp. Leaf359]|nr:hypothetical protein ASG38_15250 [Flavobacterium sp. Leaf359]
MTLASIALFGFPYDNVKLFSVSGDVNRTESFMISIPQNGSVPEALKKTSFVCLMAILSFDTERESVPLTSFSADLGLQLINRKLKAANAIIDCFFMRFIF